MSSVWRQPRFDLNKFLDAVLQGNFTFEPPLQHIFSAISCQAGFEAELQNAEDYSSKVGIVTQFFPFHKLPNILRSMGLLLMKNEGLVKLVVPDADKYEISGNNEKALQFYTIALTFAPTEDVATLFQIYKKRAAILFKMRKFDLAIMDMEMALRYGEAETDVLKDQLREEKDACETFVVPKVLTELELICEKYRHKIISQVNGEEFDSITVLPNFISVKSDPVKGRYLVTDIDLEPGTTVLVEEPFVCLVEGQLKWQTKRCVYCLKETLNPIPCERCIFSIYCGLECRSKDYEHGHKFECHLLPFVHSMQLSRTEHLAMKGICRGGPSILKEIYDKSKDVDKLKDDFYIPLNIPPEDSDRYRYIQFLSMKSHDRPSDMPKIAFLAVSFAYALRTKTSFFDAIEDSEMAEFEQFIATVFIQHSQSLPYNTMGLTATEVEILDIKAHIDDINGRRDIQTAVGIYPIVNLLNHSCAANTVRQHLARGRVAIVTNRQLKKGDILTHGYGYSYQMMSLKNRRKELAKYYHFHCDCIACEENWPLISDMENSKKLTFVCGPCQWRVMDLLSRYNITDVVDDLLKFECSTSKYEGNPLKKSVPCSPSSMILRIGFRLVLENRPTEAVPLMRECIKFYQKEPGQPSLQLIQAQNTLVCAYDVISNRVIEPQVLPAAEKEESEEKEVPKARKGCSCSIA